MVFSVISIEAPRVDIDKWISLSFKDNELRMMCYNSLVVEMSMLPDWQAATRRLSAHKPDGCTCLWPGFLVRCCYRRKIVDCPTGLFCVC
jgi:hypothetical protein